MQHTFFCWRPYATGRLEDSGHQNDEKMSRETVHSRSCVTFFRYSAVLRLPADLFRKVVSLINWWILFWRLLFFSHARNTTAKTVLGSTRSCNVRLQFLRASPSHHRWTQFANVGKNDTTDHFTVVCLVAWPLNENESGGDLVLINLPAFLLLKMLFSC